MAGTKKGYNDEGWEEYTVGALHALPLFQAASVGASQVSTTVQAAFVTPCRLKLSQIAVYFSAISHILGEIQFNIVVGTGAYETAAATFASGTFTITGSPTDGQNNTYTIGGVAYNVPQATANNTTQQATADAAALNLIAGFAALYVASSSTNVVTVKYHVPGTAGNGITTTASGNAGDTLTANQASLTGGAGATGITTVANDNATMPYLQQASTAQPVQVVGGGAGPTTNFATAGQALFAQDVPVLAANFPATSGFGALATGTGGVGVFSDTTLAAMTELNGQPIGTNQNWPSVALAASDAVFQRGQVLTLRCITPSGGSITGLQVVAVAEVRPLNWPPSPQQVQLNQPLQGIQLNGTNTGPVLKNVRPVSGLTY